MNNIYKNGEWYAKEILKINFDLEFDEDYFDDNSRSNMPDFKYKDGRFLEVTETAFSRYMKDYFYGLNDDYINSLDIEYNTLRRKLSDINQKTDETNSLKRAMELETLTNLSREIMLQKNISEMRVRNTFDLKFDYSIKNIIDAILNKSKKHENKNIDLFLYVCKEEMNLLINEVDKYDIKILKSVIKDSVFQNIFICETDYRKDNLYTFSHQRIICIDKFNLNDNSFKYHFISSIELKYGIQTVLNNGIASYIRFVFEDKSYDLISEFLSSERPNIAFVYQIMNVLRGEEKEITYSGNMFIWTIRSNYTSIMYSDKNINKKCILSTKILLSIITDWNSRLDAFNKEEKKRINTTRSLINSIESDYFKGQKIPHRFLNPVLIKINNEYRLLITFIKYTATQLRANKLKMPSEYFICDINNGKIIDKFKINNDTLVDSYMIGKEIDNDNTSKKNTLLMRSYLDSIRYDLVINNYFNYVLYNRYLKIMNSEVMKIYGHFSNK